MSEQRGGNGLGPACCGPMKRLRRAGSRNGMPITGRDVEIVDGAGLDLLKNYVKRQSSVDSRCH